MTDEQISICKKFGSDFAESPNHFKVGISENLLMSEDQPIHGLRHQQEGDTTGWYIWAGEYSAASDFFKPIHMQHLSEKHPNLMKYLGLAPGWRFLIDNKGHEDIWYDSNLLTNT